MAVYNKTHFSMRSALYADLTLTYAQPLLTLFPSVFYQPSSLHLLGTQAGCNVGRSKTKQN